MSDASRRPRVTVNCVALKGVVPFDCAELAPAISQRSFGRGRLGMVEEDAARGVTVVAVGMIRLEWTLGDGRRQVFGFKVRGDVLRTPCDAPWIDAVAVTPGILYHIETETFARSREMENWALTTAYANLARMTTLVTALGRLTARERIVSFLLEMAERTGETRNGGTRVALPMCRNDIADYLGLNAETVSRQLARLKQQGLIAMPKPAHAVVPDMAALAALSPLVFRPLNRGPGATPRRRPTG